MTEGTENPDTIEPVETSDYIELPVPVPEDPTSAPRPEQPLEDAAAPDDATTPSEPVDEEAATPDDATAPAEQPLEDAAAPDDATTSEPVEGVDDVAAAVAEASANIGEGDVAVTPSAATADAAASLAVPNAVSVSWIPFIIYDLLWLVFAGLIVWQFSELPLGQAVFESELYSLAILGGLVLVVAGPLLIVAVWIASWGREGARKGPLFISSMLKGSIATIVGVVMWQGALLVLDQLRLGRLL